VVLLVGPPSRDRVDAADAPNGADLRAQVDALVARGATRKDAVRAVSDRTGVARNVVYDAAVAKS